MDDLFEEVRMDIETKDQCIQNIGHTFMTHHGILDKDFSEEIIKNLPRLPATQFPVSKISWFVIIISQTWNPKMIGNHSQLRERRITTNPGISCSQSTFKESFLHAWKQTYEQINDFCNTFCIQYKSRNKFYIKEMEFLSAVLQVWFVDDDIKWLK